MTTLLNKFSIRAALMFAAICPVASHAATDAPFKAVMQTKEVLALNPAACPLTPFLQGTTTGSGNAMHMGKITGVATDCVTPTDSSFTFTGGLLVLTAANGDTLTAEYSGSLIPTAAYPIYTISGSYRLTGGTGRFVSATGSGTLQGYSNIVSGAGSYTASGTISY